MKVKGIHIPGYHSGKVMVSVYAVFTMTNGKKYRTYMYGTELRRNDERIEHFDHDLEYEDDLLQQYFDGSRTDCGPDFVNLGGEILMRPQMVTAIVKFKTKRITRRKLDKRTKAEATYAAKRQEEMKDNPIFILFKEALEASGYADKFKLSKLSVGASIEAYPDTPERIYINTIHNPHGAPDTPWRVHYYTEKDGPTEPELFASPGDAIAYAVKCAQSAKIWD